MKSIKWLIFSGLLGWCSSFAPEVTLAQQGIDIQQVLESQSKSWLSKADQESKLAASLLSQGKMVEAIEHARQASEYIKTALGDSHVSYAQSLVDLARLTAQAGSVELTESYMKQALEASIRIHGEQSPPTGELYFMLGEFYRQLEDYTNANTNLEKSYEIRKATLGPEHFETTISLNDWAITRDSMGYSVEAKQLHEECLAIRQRTLPADHPAVLLSLSNFASMLIRFKQHEKALKLLEPLPKKYLQQRSWDKEGYALTLSSLSTCYYELGRYQDAAKAFIEQFQAEQQLQGNTKEELAALSLAIFSLQECEKWDEADGYIETAQSIYTKLGTEDRRIVRELLWYRSRSLMRKDDRQAALESCRKINEMNLTDFGPSSWPYVDTLLDLSVELEDGPDSKAGFETYQKALTIAKALPSKDEVAATVTKLRVTAQLHLDRGNLAIAERHVEDGIALFHSLADLRTWRLSDLEGVLIDILQKRGESERATLISSRRTERLKSEEQYYIDPLDVDLRSQNNHAESLRIAGKYDEAEPIYRDAIERCKAADLQRTEIYATLLNNLGLLYDEKSKLDKAEELMREALELRIDLKGEDDELSANSMSTLGHVLVDKKEYEEALTLFEKAYPVRCRELGFDHEKTQITRQGFASAYEGAGQPIEAVKLFDIQVRSALKNVGRNVFSLSEIEQPLFLETVLHGYLTIAIQRAFKHKNVPEVTAYAAEWLINGKGRLLESLTRRNVMQRKSEDPELRKVNEQLETVRRKLAMATSAQSSYEDLAARTEAITKLSEEEIALDTELARLAGGRIRSVLDWVTCDQVSRALDDQTAFIDLDVVSDPKYPVGSILQSRSHKIVAWITYGDEKRKPVCVELANKVATDKALVRMMTRSFVPSNAKISLNEFKREFAVDMRESGEELYHLCLKPLESHLDGVSKLVICPQGSTWLVPWAAIPLPGPKKEFMVERYEISLVSSGRECVVSDTEPASNWAAVFTDPNYDLGLAEKKTTLTKLLKGNVNYDEQLSQSFVPQSGFQKVSGLKETNALATRIEPKIKKRLGGNVFVFRQNEAVETLTKRLDNPRLLFFATHGYMIDPQHLQQLQLQLKLPPEKTWILRDPLLRWGMLMAGCNEKNAFVAGDDGVLTAIEILSMRLERTELVFLASCYAGGGELVEEWRGLTGVREAFHRAGARSVIAAQWAIPIDETLLICDRFFENYANGMTAAAALRKAQIAVIESEREEFGESNLMSWAGLSLTGR